MPSLRNGFAHALHATGRMSGDTWGCNDAGMADKLRENRLSELGTSKQQAFPDYMTNNPMPHGKPWGQMTSKNTNYYSHRPETGTTRYYDWTVSKVNASPDGVQVPMLLVNDQYPGPTIEANWGDWIEVKLYNNISDEGTGIHWHGNLQQETPYMDGVPGVGQCPIAPGSSFTYRFKADLYGSSWWHSHYEAQYGSGMIGPMVIYGPKNMDYDIDVGPIMINDFYHSYYQPIEEGILSVPVEVPFSSNVLINGKGTFNCSDTDLPCEEHAPLPSFNFTSGKVHRLRLINPSSFAVHKITIDGMKFKVIANDFVEIEPYETDVITLAVGQRSDVLVYGDGEPTDSTWLRAWMSPACSPTTAGYREMKAAIFYEDADRSRQPTTEPGPNAYNNYCGNDPLEQTVPYYPLGFEENPPVTEVLPIELKSNGSSIIWYMANRTARVNFNEPTLRQAETGNLDFEYIENVHNYGDNSSIRFIVQNTGFQPHPMHLHGHNMQILAEGPCTDNNTVFPDGSPIPPAVIQGGNAVPNGPDPFGELNRDANDAAPAAGPPSKREASPWGNHGGNGNYQGGGSGSGHGVHQNHRNGDRSAQQSGYNDSNDDNENSDDNCNTSDPAGCAPPTASTVPLPNANNTASETMQTYGMCWDGHVTNPSNPQRRDVQMLLPGHYIVVQWKQDNPGIWPFHCHIAWHLSAGFVWNVLEDPAGIAKQHPVIPEVLEQTCRDWDLWTQNNRPDQIGDGI